MYYSNNRQGAAPSSPPHVTYYNLPPAPAAAPSVAPLPAAYPPSSSSSQPAGAPVVRYFHQPPPPAPDPPPLPSSYPSAQSSFFPSRLPPASFSQPNSSSSAFPQPPYAAAVQPLNLAATPLSFSLTRPAPLPLSATSSSYAPLRPPTPIQHLPVQPLYQRPQPLQAAAPLSASAALRPAPAYQYAVSTPMQMPPPVLMQPTVSAASAYSPQYPGMRAPSPPAAQLLSAQSFNPQLLQSQPAPLPPAHSARAQPILRPSQLQISSAPSQRQPPPPPYHAAAHHPSVPYPPPQLHHMQSLQSPAPPSLQRAVSLPQSSAAAPQPERSLTSFAQLRRPQPARGSVPSTPMSPLDAPSFSDFSASAPPAAGAAFVHQPAVATPQPPSRSASPSAPLLPASPSSSLSRSEKRVLSLQQKQKAAEQQKKEKRVELEGLLAHEMQLMADVLDWREAGEDEDEEERPRDASLYSLLFPGMGKEDGRREAWMKALQEMERRRQQLQQELGLRKRAAGAAEGSAERFEDLLSGVMERIDDYRGMQGWLLQLQLHGRAMKEAKEAGEREEADVAALLAAITSPHSLHALLLVLLLYAKDAGMSSEVVRLLLGYMEWDSRCVLPFLDCDLLSCVTSCLHHSPHSPELVDAAFRLFLFLSSSFRHQRRMLAHQVQCNAIQLLNERDIAVWDKDGQLSRLAFSLLSSFVSVSEENRDRLVQAGALSAIVTRLSRQPQQQQLVLDGLSCLDTLTVSFTLYATVLSVDASMHTLLAVCAQQPESVSLQRLCVSILLRLCEHNEANKERACRAPVGELSTLLTCLHYHTVQEDLAMTCCMLLSLLLEYRQKHAAAVGHVKEQDVTRGIDTLIPVLHTHLYSPQLQVHATSALYFLLATLPMWRLSLSSPTQLLLVDVLTRALHMYVSDVLYMRHCCSCLLQLIVYYPAVGEKVRSMGIQAELERVRGRMRRMAAGGRMDDDSEECLTVLNTLLNVLVTNEKAMKQQQINSEEAERQRQLQQQLQPPALEHQPEQQQQQQQAQQEPVKEAAMAAASVSSPADAKAVSSVRAAAASIVTKLKKKNKKKSATEGLQALLIAAASAPSAASPPSSAAVSAPAPSPTASASVPAGSSTPKTGKDVDLVGLYWDASSSSSSSSAAAAASSVPAVPALRLTVPAESQVILVPPAALEPALTAPLMTASSFLQPDFKPRVFLTQVREDPMQLSASSSPSQPAYSAAQEAEAALVTRSLNGDAEPADRAKEEVEEAKQQQEAEAKAEKEAEAAVATVRQSIAAAVHSLKNNTPAPFQLHSLSLLLSFTTTAASPTPPSSSPSSSSSSSSAPALAASVVIELLQREKASLHIIRSMRRLESNEDVQRLSLALLSFIASSPSQRALLSSQGAVEAVVTSLQMGRDTAQQALHCLSLLTQDRSVAQQVRRTSVVHVVFIVLKRWQRETGVQRWGCEVCRRIGDVDRAEVAGMLDGLGLTVVVNAMERAMAAAEGEERNAVLEAGVELLGWRWLNRRGAAGMGAEVNARELELVCESLALDDERVRRKASDVLRALWEVSRRRRALREKMETARVMERLADADSRSRSQPRLAELGAEADEEKAEADAPVPVSLPQEEKTATTPRQAEQQSDEGQHQEAEPEAEHSAHAEAEKDSEPVAQGDVTPTAASLAAANGHREAEREAEAAAERQQALQEGIRRFKTKAKSGIQWMQEHRLLGSTPDAVARFLLTTPALDKAAVGSYLGEASAFPKSVLAAYLEALDFRGETLDASLRRLMSGLQLPREANGIDRLLVQFTQSFHRHNPQSFSSADAVYALSYALILLNSDAHSGLSSKRVASKQHFIQQARSIDVDVNQAVLADMYDRILATEISMTHTSSSSGGSRAEAPQPAAAAQAVTVQQGEGGGVETQSEQAAVAAAEPAAAPAAEGQADGLLAAGKRLFRLGRRKKQQPAAENGRRGSAGSSKTSLIIN